MWAVMKLYGHDSLELYGRDGRRIYIDNSSIAEQGIVGFIPVFSTREDAILFDGSDEHIVGVAFADTSTNNPEGGKLQ